MLLASIELHQSTHGQIYTLGSQRQTGPLQHSNPQPHAATVFIDEVFWSSKRSWEVEDWLDAFSNFCQEWHIYRQSL